MPSNFNNRIRSPNIRTALCERTGWVHSTFQPPVFDSLFAGFQPMTSAVRRSPNGKKNNPSPALLRTRMTFD
jgi:hypothetical protein